MKYLLNLLIIMGLAACEMGVEEHAPPRIGAFPVATQSALGFSSLPPKDSLPALPPIDYDTAEWTELIRLDSSVVIDLRYATMENFVDTIMYQCGRCFLRPAVAKAVAAAHRSLSPLGYRLLMLDCYRPRPIQWRLWRKVPDPRYVSDPRKGSMHNRGAAVDLTLADTRGRELDMGTPFDFFGPEAYPAYTNLPDSILERRTLLRETMLQHGFRAIRTEWWHFAFVGAGSPLSDWEWNCPEAAPSAALMPAGGSTTPR